MIRLFTILIVALLVGASLAWLADHPGKVVMEWDTWLVETSLAVLAVLVALLLFTALMLQKLWFWLRREMPLVGAQRHLRQQKRGLDAMNKSVLALSSGRVDEAEKLIEKTKRLLPPQPMLHVLESQAAQLAGNKEKAKQAFEAMLEDKSAAMIGIRGLLASALEEGRPNEALRLAQAAREEDPKSVWALDTLLSVLTSQAKWAEALELLTGSSARLIDGDRLKKVKMVLNYCLAQEADLAGHGKEARAFALAAYGYDKGFEPLVVKLVKYAVADGKLAKAKTYIETAWKLNPTAKLAEAFVQIDPNERPLERYKRFEKLIEHNKSHVESKLQRADKAIAAGKFEVARPIIESLMAKNNEPRAFNLKAELVVAEGAEGFEIEAEKWRVEGQKIAQKPSYYCNSCNSPHTVWHHHCKHCGLFDGLVLGDNLEKLSANKLKPVGQNSGIGLIPN